MPLMVGIEFVVTTRWPKPGCDLGTPAAAEDDEDDGTPEADIMPASGAGPPPFRVGDPLVAMAATPGGAYCGEMTEAPAMGISPDVGVCCESMVSEVWYDEFDGYDDEVVLYDVMVWKDELVWYVGESVDRSSSCVLGDSCGARCDLRLSRSIRLTAHSRRSTGVRLAAWTKASRSC